MTVKSNDEVGGSTTSSILCDWHVFSKNNWREQYVPRRNQDDQFALQDVKPAFRRTIRTKAIRP
jgi:hypothetical protein